MGRPSSASDHTEMRPSEVEIAEEVLAAEREAKELEDRLKEETAFLNSDRQLNKLVLSQIGLACKKGKLLPREIPQKIVMVPAGSWTVENGLLTASKKSLSKPKLMEIFKNQLHKLYEADAAIGGA